MIRASIVALCVLLGGCVRIESSPLGAKQDKRPIDYPIALYLPDMTSPVPLLRAAGDHKQPEDVPEGCLVVGRIELLGAPASSWSSVISHAKSSARNLGGDAIVYELADSPVTASYGGGSSVYVPNGSAPYSVSSGASVPMHGKHAQFTVLRYPDEHADATK